MIRLSEEFEADLMPALGIEQRAVHRVTLSRFASLAVVPRTAPDTLLRAAVERAPGSARTCPAC